MRSPAPARVDINEQNPQAAGFSAHHGFEVAGRSERDDAGRPYPILHLQLAAPWQLRTLDHLRDALPGAQVEAYGSATDPASLDAWSDLDVRIRTDAPVDVAAALGAPIWALQHVVAEERTVVRTILANRQEGTGHHRFAIGEDARAREVLEALQGPLTPWTALEAFSHFAARRRELDPAYRPDATGLEALILRGTTGRPC